MTFIKSDKDKYSLQPLVVYVAQDGMLHVVDGQQRLTTINILLNFLHLRSYTIKYESRPNQRNIRTEDSSNIDQYHINQAYDTIARWFENNHYQNDFRALLEGNTPKRVIFIWYQTTDDEVATFIRLNKDKIALTNAELIKALLLKKGNFSGDSILFQKSIAVEWNKIENTFNDNAFWCFIRPIEDRRATRIDFLFDLIKEKKLLKSSDSIPYTPKEDVGNDRYTTFRFFYGYFKEYRELAFNAIWEQVNRIYNIFVHWYNEIELYHYIGFLVVDNPECIGELIDEWVKPNMTIDVFKTSLRTRINEVIKRSNCNNLSRQYKYNDERNPDKTACRPILLLFNIQRIIILNRSMSQISDTQIFNKFPFHLFKEENWNVEHIASNTDNELSKVDAQKALLKTYLLDKEISDKNKNEIKNFVQQKNPDKSIFDNILQNLDNEQQGALANNEQLNDQQKNQIWNFCLLDEHTNKSYGNSIFPVKRRIIMGKEMGKKYEIDDNLQETIVPNTIAFVPLCTKDAFIKAYTAQATSHREWSITDAKAYKQEMLDCLKTEFNIYE